MDDQARKATRELARTGEGERDVLVARLRSGELSEEGVTIASWAGDPATRQVVPLSCSGPSAEHFDRRTMVSLGQAYRNESWGIASQATASVIGYTGHGAPVRVVRFAGLLYLMDNEGHLHVSNDDGGSWRRGDLPASCSASPPVLRCDLCAAESTVYGLLDCLPLRPFLLSEKSLPLALATTVASQLTPMWQKIHVLECPSCVGEGTGPHNVDPAGWDPKVHHPHFKGRTRCGYCRGHGSLSDDRVSNAVATSLHLYRDVTRDRHRESRVALRDRLYMTRRPLGQETIPPGSQRGRRHVSVDPTDRPGPPDPRPSLHVGR